MIRPRVVFDCNIFIQAAAFDNGPAAACVGLVERSAVELFVGKAVVAELRRVLVYKEITDLSPISRPNGPQPFLNE